MLAVVAAVSATAASGVIAPALPDAPSIHAQAVQAQAAGTTVLRATDGMFYVTAQVNDMPVRFLIDTGASDVVLTTADAARVGLLGTGEAGSFRTMNGTGAMRRLKLARVNVPGVALTDVDALIPSAGGDLPTSLMGQSMLARLDRLHIDGDRLIL